MNSTAASGHWPNCLAIALALATFPLIWIGGLVTTYDAGMAVPDWPQTYGYWFYYPIRYWLAARDIFLEHSHRMIGTVVGLLTIALALALWRMDRRRWVRWLGLAALLGVCAQGTLGGLRVRMNEVLLADIHGCVAPLFFALTTALVAITSVAWQTLPAARPHPAAVRLRRLSLAVTVLVYFQIVFGAQLRHMARLIGASSLSLWVWLHVASALVIAAGVTWLVWAALRSAPRPHLLRPALSAEPSGATGSLPARAGAALADKPPAAPVPQTNRDSIEPQEPVFLRAFLVRRATLLGAVFAVQLLLGAATWVTKYGWPAWFSTYVWSLEFTVVSGGRFPSHLTTAHVAFGSLMLVTSLSLTLWTRRLLRPV
jgi:cytochrome c oxidase assembly protein subunit 15